MGELIKIAYDNFHMDFSAYCHKFSNIASHSIYKTALSIGISFVTLLGRTYKNSL
jgi:hypothetical protein